MHWLIAVAVVGVALALIGLGFLLGLATAGVFVVRETVFEVTADGDTRAADALE